MTYYIELDSARWNTLFGKMYLVDGEYFIDEVEHHCLIAVDKTSFTLDIPGNES